MLLRSFAKQNCYIQIQLRTRKKTLYINTLAHNLTAICSVLKFLRTQEVKKRSELHSWFFSGTTTENFVSGILFTVLPHRDVLPVRVVASRQFLV